MSRPRRSPRTGRIAGLALLAAGCGGPKLSQSWQLDRLRVLGVRAVPAEPRPGETVALERLLYLPAGASLGGVAWFACLPENADEFGCPVDPDLQAALEGADPESMSPEELAALYEQAVAAGLVGFEPWLAPTWTPPEDALDGLDAREATEGVSALVQLVALPGGGDDAAEEAEPAYKRVPVSLAATPNHNPVLAGFEVDGEAVEAGGTVAVGPGEAVDLTPALDDPEEYVYLDSAGEEETRTEEPYLTWYAEGGAFDQPFSLYPYTTATWTAPDRAWEGWVVAVARDRRGGMAWASLRVSVE